MPRLLKTLPITVGFLSMVGVLSGCGQQTASAGHPPAVRPTVQPSPTASGASTKNTSPKSSAAAMKTLPPITTLKWSSPTVGYLVAASTIYRTVTGGHSWTPWYQSPHVMSALTLTSQRVWATTAHSLLEISGRQANHLEQSITLPVTGVPQTIAVESSPDAYVLEAGHIYKRNLATNHWTLVSNTLGSIHSMVWLSPTTGYATVGKTLWRTTSGGQAWTVAFSAPVAGHHWQGRIVANSANSLWLLVTGGVIGMSQTGFVLWHGTAKGTQWTAITDEAYWAPTGYPSVHPAVSSSIMQPGDLVTTGQHTVYLTGWNSNPTSHWILFTNHLGQWTSATVPITPRVPDFFMPPTILSFSTSTTGFLAGQNTMAQGSLLESKNGGPWHSLPVIIK